MNNKVSFFLMSEKGYYVLKNLIDKNRHHQIDFVVSARDNNVQKDFYLEIRELCLQYNISFFDRSENFDMKSEYSISISWRWIIKLNSKLIVFHDSLLPKYRGFAPVVNSLINFEPKIGVTALFAAENYDEGPIISQKSMNVIYPVKVQDVIDRLKVLYFELVLQILEIIQENKIFKLEIQEEKDASFSIWRDEEDYKIDWQLSSIQILQFIYSVGFPYKGAFTKFDKYDRVRIFDAEILEDVVVENRHVGKVIFYNDNCPVVICGKGLLKLGKLYDDNMEEISINKFRTRFL